MRGASWVNDFGREQHRKAVRVAREEKKKREGKKYKLIKVCDKPPTYKEVEVID